MFTATTATELPARPEARHRIAPWWMGYLFLSPLRRLWENPRRLLTPWVRPGDRVLELGCSMGFFTLDIARLVGPEGRVVAVDVQQRVLDTLAGRVRRAGLADRVELRLGTAGDPRIDDLAGSFDVVHAHHVLHEVGDPERMAGRLAAALRPGGLLHLAEPAGHVTPEFFAWECRLFGETGLVLEARPRAARQRTAVFRRVQGP